MLFDEDIRLDEDDPALEAMSQVAEVWTRRKIFERSKNAERFAAWEARKAMIFAEDVRIPPVNHPKPNVMAFRRVGAAHGR